MIIGAEVVDLRIRLRISERNGRNIWWRLAEWSDDGGKRFAVTFLLSPPFFCLTLPIRRSMPIPLIRRPIIEETGVFSLLGKRHALRTNVVVRG